MHSRTHSKLTIEEICLMVSQLNVWKDFPSVLFRGIDKAGRACHFKKLACSQGNSAEEIDIFKRNSMKLRKKFSMSGCLIHTCNAQIYI